MGFDVVLSFLKIKNLAIIEHSEIEFSNGLNIITGETGAGKSIILKSIGLLSGQRATTELVRKGCQSSSIEGIFEIEKNLIQTIKNSSDELDSLLDEETVNTGEIIIRRQIDKSGKNKIFINGSLTTLSSLQILSSFIIDITGQHQQQSLVNTNIQRELVDNYGLVEKIIKKKSLTNVANAYRDYLSANRELETLKQNLETNSLEFITEQFKELENASLRAGEKEEVSEINSKFRNLEEISTNINSAIELLNNSESIKKALYEVEDAKKHDENLKEIEEKLVDASSGINDAVLMLETYQSSLNIDPETLENARIRLSEISYLERKYRKPEEELISFSLELKKQIKELEESDWAIKELEKKLKIAKDNLSAKEAILSEERTKTAKKLSSKVDKELEALGMIGAKFKIEVAQKESSIIGVDHINFLLAANKGEGFRILSKVASGGELSRVLLILKGINQSNSSNITQIFDEIDTGIGGEIAGLVAKRLKKLSKANQIIIITHSAQIASYAKLHLHVEKKEVKNRTSSNIKILSEEQRAENLAIMLAGSKNSKSVISTAHELLKNSHN